MEAIKEEVKEAGEKTEKVKTFFKNIPGKAKSIFSEKKDDESEEKKASDIAFEYVEKIAEEQGVEPEDLVLQFGVEKAAEYLDEVLFEMEKEAGLGDKLRSMGTSAVEHGKKMVSSPGKRALTGAAVGAGVGAGWAALKNKKDDDTKTKVKRYLKGIGGGAAAGAGAKAAGEKAYNVGKTVKGLHDARLKNAPGLGKTKFLGSDIKEGLRTELGNTKNQIAGAYQSSKDSLTSGKNKIKNMFKKKEAKTPRAEGDHGGINKNMSDSFENTLYTLAQEKLYNNQ
jgi:hypothetical protein